MSRCRARQRAQYARSPPPLFCSVLCLCSYSILLLLLYSVPSASFLSCPTSPLRYATCLASQLEDTSIRLISAGESEAAKLLCQAGTNPTNPSCTRLRHGAQCVSCVCHQCTCISKHVSCHIHCLEERTPSCMQCCAPYAMVAVDTCNHEPGLMSYMLRNTTHI